MHRTFIVMSPRWKGCLDVTSSLHGMGVAIQERAERRCVVFSSETVQTVPQLKCLWWQIDSPKTLRNRREIAFDAAGSDVRSNDALAVFIGEAGKHIAEAVGDLCFAEKPRNVGHGLVAGYQSFKVARLRGMHNGDAKPSCQLTRSLPEKGSHERLVIRLLRRHRMPQVPPARSADDEIHFADEPARGLGTDQFPAQGRAHGTGRSRENAVIRTSDVIAVLPHGRQILVVAIVLPIWKDEEKAVEAVAPRLGEERAADDAVVRARELTQ